MDKTTVQLEKWKDGQDHGTTWEMESWTTQLWSDHELGAAKNMDAHLFNQIETEQRARLCPCGAAQLIS